MTEPIPGTILSATKSMLEDNDPEWIKKNHIGSENADNLLHKLPYLAETHTTDQTMHSVIHELLHQGENINGCGGTEFTPITRAAVCRNLRMCKILKDLGADVNACTKTGRTLSFDDVDIFSPLSASAWRGDYSVLFWFLKNGAKPRNDNTAMAILKSLTRSYTSTEANLSLVVDEFKKCGLIISLNLLVDYAIDQSTERLAMVYMKHSISSGKNADFINSIFNKAAEQGMVKLVCLLIQQQPGLLQTHWIVDENIPRKLAIHGGFVAWLLEYKSRPLDLQKLCKCAIRDQLANRRDEETGQLQPLEKSIDLLPLPGCLKEYLIDTNDLCPWMQQKCNELSDEIRSLVYYC